MTVEIKILNEDLEGVILDDRLTAGAVCQTCIDLRPGEFMGKGTRQQEIHQRRHRKLKRRKQRRHRLIELLEQGETREARRRIAREGLAGQEPSDR